MTEFPINRWGWITQLNIENMGAIDNGVATLGSIEFTVNAPYRKEIIDTLYRFAKNGRSPSWAEEWMCLYCASPNGLTMTHCSQCGGPRNWILG